jgi:hypothetical protein
MDILRQQFWRWRQFCFPLREPQRKPTAMKSNS